MNGYQPVDQSIQWIREYMESDTFKDTSEKDLVNQLRLGKLDNFHGMKDTEPFVKTPRGVMRMCTDATPQTPDSYIYFGYVIAKRLRENGLDPEKWGTSTPANEQWLANYGQCGC